MERGQYTEIEFEKAYERIERRLIENISITKEKRAFILGGQPGAGKSGLTAVLEGENENLILINADEFRKKHPHYKELKEEFGDEYVAHTQKFIGKMTETLIDRLSTKGYNIIVEGTLRTKEAPLKTRDILKSKGYDVELCIIQVRPEDSLLGTHQRYEKMIELGTVARGTPKEAHNIVIKTLPENLSFLYNGGYFSDIRIYNRELECLYSMKKTPEIDPGILMKREFERVLTEGEKENLKVKYNKLIEKMEKRDATSQEIERILEEKKEI